MHYPSVFCIIVTHNGERYIHQCLERLLNSTIPVKVVVVDNNSSDRTISIVKRYIDRVNLIPLRQNLGFGKANNVGLSYSSFNEADYVFLLNQDVYVRKETIQKLVEIASENLHFGIISPIHLNGIGKDIDPLFAGFVSPPSCGLLLDLRNNVDKVKTLYECGFVNAAAWLITKRCYKSVGGFDPLFDHYGEDDDYVNRVMFKNFLIGVTPLTYIHHDRVCHKLSLRSQYYQQKLRYFVILKDLRLKYLFTYFNIFNSLIKRLIIGLVKFRFNSVKVDAKLILTLIMNFNAIRKSRIKCLYHDMPFI